MIGGERRGVDADECEGSEVYSHITSVLTILRNYIHALIVNSLFCCSV